MLTSCRRLPGLLLTCLLLMTATVAAALQGGELLTPGVTREERLTERESHRYRLELAAGRRWRVQLEQLGIDVELVASWRGQGAPWRVDSPIDWDGTELLLFPERAAGVASLEVRRRGSRLIPAEASGPYRIRLDPVDGPEAPLELEALAAMTAAGRAWAAGSGDDRRRALAHYGAAIDLWRRLHRPRLAAQSLYAAGVLHRLLGEPAPALELARQALPLWHGLADAGREADTLNEIGLLETSLGRHDAARAALGEALAVQQRAGDLFRQVATANNLCRTFNQQGLHLEARDCFGSALERARAAGDDETEAVVLHNLGGVEQQLGLPEEALEHYGRALELHRAAGRTRRVAETLNNLANVHFSVAEQEAALELYLQAFEIFREIGDGRWEARVLHNLGGTYHALGDPERAAGFYERALGMRRELGDRAGEAVELRSLGGTELALGRPARARERFTRSLALEQAAGDLAGEGTTWCLLAEASAALSEPERARELFDRSIARLRELDARPALARALSGKGESLLALGRPEEAFGALSEALDVYRALGHRRAEAHALYLLAEAQRATGEPARALVLVEAALQAIESVRAELGDADLSATFAGAHRDSYELQVDLLIDRTAVREALEASERARAWGLLELLRQVAPESVGTEGSELAAALRRARRQLRVRAEQRREVLAGQPSQLAAQVEADYLVALAELERREAEVRRARPERAELVQPEPPNADEIRGLLDPATVLVEYSLGRDRSFVFVVTREEIRVFELAPRARLETAARRFHEALSSPHDNARDQELQAAELSRLLLAPVVAELAGRAAPVERLVVVADGALHYLPFAALPVPSPDAADQVRLLSRWEVVRLPSAAVLVAERRRRAGRAPAPLALAVFADPVFDRDDPRVRAAGEPAAAAPATLRPAGLGLPRLRTSRREAEVVAALVRADHSPDDALVALDFAADRDLALDPRLALYRVLHFATHGVIDARYPALSGLVLSLVGEDGRPRDGFLSLRDIYGLELDADLVVLSACRTALGREVRGEGLVGLTRGFLHAGASRVLASLWPVSDRATTELMERFYRALFEDRLSPAAALRRAQLSMLGERRWQDPYNWAGFVLLGDWQTTNPTAR